MRKLFKGIIIFLVILLALVAGGVFTLWYMLQPPKQEAIQYQTKRLIEQANNQLKDVDQKRVDKLAPKIIEKSIDQLQESVTKGELTYADITAFYLMRIRDIDQSNVIINSFAEINPEAMEQAQQSDQLRSSINLEQKPLYGMPVTLKDNIITDNMPMSAGTYMLRDFRSDKNAEVAKQLLDKGAIILGKVNLSELANFVDPNMPSGYSSKVGQTRNPFGLLTLDPAGSSTGSAASVTSNMAVTSIGTETTGSIIAPASLQSVVGFKPTRGAISSEGIFPLSSSLDTAGTLARSVKDAVITYNSSISDPKLSIDLSLLDNASLSGKTIGVVDDDSQDHQKLVNQLKKLGAKVVKIQINTDKLDNSAIIFNDFANDVAKFAQDYSLPFSSLKQLRDFNAKDMSRRAKYGQSYVDEAVKVKQFDPMLGIKQAEYATKILNDLNTKYNIDAFVSFNNSDVLAPAVAGTPAITVPFGKSSDDDTLLGATFYGTKEFSDAQVAQIAHAFEKATHARLAPAFK